MLKTTIVLLTLMSIGNIFKGDFGMIYAVVGDNALLYDTTDVIDTYVYRIFRTNSNLGMSTAVSVFQSLVGLIMVLVQTLSLRRLTLTLQCSKKGKENRYEGKWKENKTGKDTILMNIILVIIIGGFCVLCLVPFIMMIGSSFETEYNLSHYGYTLAKEFTIRCV